MRIPFQIWDMFCGFLFMGKGYMILLANSNALRRGCRANKPAASISLATILSRWKWPSGISSDLEWEPLHVHPLLLNVRLFLLNVYPEMLD